MRKFNYILKDKTKTIKEVERDYIKVINAGLINKKIADASILKEILLCPPNTMNDELHLDFIKRLRPITYNLVDKKFILFDFFFGKEYSQLQPIISKFISENFSFKICPYCGIDYVNSFKECLSYYMNFSDFLINSTHKELKRLKRIGDGKAKEILLNRSSLAQKDFEKKYSKYESSFKQLKLKPQFHNHYTLDHIIPKAKYPLFQISLYNLIPVCYSCNTKFKGEYELENCVIPNSDGYVLESGLKFCLLKEEDSFKINYKLIHSSDSKSINDYMKEFKIIGRYNEHLDIVLSLKEKAEKYNDVKILEISRQTGISVEELKEMIFGVDVINGEPDSQLFKLKNDISKDFGIL
ncbi:HNH endonuclease [Myroides guanonis]|uniref:HNH endonuclease n=1 Tax=Myroides guanonis TaxID=1150112 RepID=A0A1I3PNA3_9FLAO|nr:hypothetical protein [Myroides guanonis]SFJ22506.1 HNH endonuclease [Myroides guanonis]